MKKFLLISGFLGLVLGSAASAHPYKNPMKAMEAKVIFIFAIPR